jgi:lipid II:glycine glycyltransferase (peptidoglycan interpeptide bridge formation enzyme)
LQPDVQIAEDRETASIDLAQFREDLSCFNPKSRNMIRRAIREGVEIEIADAASGIERFVDLYYRTMQRLGASEYYLFDRVYFKRLAALVARSGFILAAVKDGRWLAAAIFIRGKRLLHYHLAANEAENRVPGVANLLIVNATRIGSNEGLLRLHLGGGRTRAKDDALWRFKQSMSTCTHVFRTGRCVHDAQAYAELRDRWLLQSPSDPKIVGQRLQFYRENP